MRKRHQPGRVGASCFAGGRLPQAAAAGQGTPVEPTLSSSRHLDRGEAGTASGEMTAWCSGYSAGMKYACANRAARGVRCRSRSRH